MIKNKIGVKILIFTLLVFMALISIVSAQEENDYNVTAKESFKDANAYMIEFLAINASYFENWKGAFIDPKPIELYDISGKKLYYQFSVYKSNKVIGKIDVCADKTLGSSVNAFEFDPEPYKAAEAKEKSKEISKERYPNGKIESTIMVVYSYPSIGAMTVVKDKTTGKKYRIFVDAYTLEEVQDKPATETEPGVWSMYEYSSENGMDNNIKDWQESVQLTDNIEQLATKKGIDINLPVTEENMKKLGLAITKNMKTMTVSATTVYPPSKSLSVPKIGQENNVFCGPASIQMVATYEKLKPLETQSKIYHNKYSGGRPDEVGGLSAPGVKDYCKYVLNKWNTEDLNKGEFSKTTVKNEIYNGRPYISAIPGHFRVCKGYSDLGYAFYISINDPKPIGKGSTRLETYGKEVAHVYVK